MTGEGEEETYELLADHRLDRSGLRIKLDKGFREGIYSIDVEYDDLATRLGFTAARRLAGQYAALLKGQLGRVTGYALGEIEDPSLAGGSRRKRDLELTFLSLPVETDDGRWHDEAMREQFRVAFLRAGQAWDQSQARMQAHRRQGREGTFRRQLAELLASEGYAGLDATARERLLDDVIALAFPPRGIGP